MQYPGYRNDCDSAFSFAVAKAQQVQNPIQPQSRNRLFGGLLDQRLGTERNTQPGNGQHRQVIGTVADCDGLLQTQAFLVRKFAQQVSLALSIDDRLDGHAGDFAIDHFQFVGIHVIDAQLRLQLFGEISEATGQDRGLVTQPFELGEQRFSAFGQPQRSADFIQHADVQPLEQRQTLLEALAEIQFAAHCPLGNLGNLLADACGLGQLVDHFGLDQRRVHVEHRQTPVAAEQRILLEGDIDIQLLGHGEELGLHGFRVGRLTAHGELDAALALVSRGIERHAPGQAIDLVDIQPVFGSDGADALQLLGGDLAGQQRHDVPCLALALDPMLIAFFGHGRETHLLVQLVGGKQDVLEHGRTLHGIRNFNQNAERQRVVDHRLTDVENVHATLSQDAGDSRSETWTVDTGDVNQDNFAQGAPPQWKKTAF
ncbi:hypothetical protein ALQ58_05440 [Pseudomonas syringae pv. apii]|nr:hypothetical protein ALQ58_05440 [Pseudomonas syringae pv. apii]